MQIFAGMTEGKRRVRWIEPLYFKNDKRDACQFWFRKPLLFHSTSCM